MDASWRKNYLRYKSFFLNMLTQYRERSDWKAYLEILLSLVTVSIFSIFALRPTLLTIAELIREIQEKKQTISQMNEKIQSLSKAQSLYDRQRGNIQILTDIAVPRRANFDVFARQLEGLSSKYQIKISNFSLGEAQIIGQPPANDNQGQITSVQDNSVFTQIPGVSQVKYSINTIAGIDQYQSVTDFTEEFENLRTISKIDTFSLTVKVDAQTKEKSIILSLEGRLPYILNDNLK